MDASVDDPENCDDVNAYLAVIEAERESRPGEAMLADEITRLRALVGPELTFSDLEVKIRDGSLSFKAMGSPEGGSPVARIVAAMLLNLLLGEDDEMPPNYRAIEWSIKPAGSFEAIRLVGEIVRDGGKSSHEIRRDLEKQLASVGSGLSPERQGESPT